jgi:hypothetical protein
MPIAGEPPDAPITQQAPAQTEQRPDATELVNESGKFVSTAERWLGRNVVQALGGTASQDLTLETSRAFKGYGSFKRFPTPENVQVLRAKQSEPGAIEAFDYAFGTGTAMMYLSVPSREALDSLMIHRNDPKAREVFDQVYGGVSKPWIELLDPKSDQSTRKLAGSMLADIYYHGFTAKTGLEYSATGDVTRGFERGLAKGVQELGQSVGLLQNDFVPPDTRPNDAPILSAFAEGIGQFTSARAIVGALAAPFAAAGSLSTGAKIVREFSLDGLANAFGFDPKDPLLADGVKHLSRYMTGDEKSLDWMYGIDSFESDAAKRGIRALEQGGVSAATILLIKAIGGLLIAGRKAKAGDTKGAEAERNLAASELEKAGQTSDQSTPASVPAASADQTAVPASAAPEPTAPLPTAAPAQQVVEPAATALSDTLPKNLAGAKPRYNYGQKGFELKFESDIEKALFITAQTRKSARDADYRGWLHGLGYSDDEINALGKSVRDSIKESAKASDEDVLTIGRIAERKSPKAETPAIGVEDKTGPQQTIDAIASTAERDMENLINGKVPENVNAASDELRQLLSMIPRDFSRQLKDIQGKVAPFADALASIAARDRYNAIRVLSDSYSFSDMKALSSLFKETTKETSKELDLLEKQYKSLLKQKQGAAADTLLVEKIEPLRELYVKLSDVDKPLGSIASDLLNLRRGKANAQADIDIQARINELRQEGITVDQIQSVLDLEASKVKIDTTELARANKALEKAIELEDKPLIRSATAAVRKAERELRSQASNTLVSRWDSMMKAFVAWSTNMKLFGLNTMALVSPISAAINITSRWAADNLILALTLQYKQIINNHAALAAAWRVEQASASRTMLSIVNDSFREAFLHDRSIVTKTKYENINTENALLSGNMTRAFVPDAVQQAFAGTKFAENVAKATDFIGHAASTPTKLMMATDSLFGKSAALIELAAKESSVFSEKLFDRMKTLKQTLDDKSLSAARREALSKEFDELKASPTIMVGKRKYTEKEWIQTQVQTAIDKNGRIVDDALAQRVDEILYKDPFTSEFGKTVEAALGNDYSRLVLTPFVRQPLRSLYRSVQDYTPFAPLSRDWRAKVGGDLGAREQRIALGKSLFGLYLMYQIWNMVDNNEVTGPSLTGTGANKANQLSGYWQPQLIKINGEWRDYSNLDQVAPIINTIHALKTTLASIETQRGLREEQQSYLDDGINTFGAVAVAIGSSLLDKPGFQTVRDLAASLEGMEKAQDYDPSLAKKGSKALGRWSAGMAPNFLNHLNNTLDPRVVQTMDFIQSWSKVINNKDILPKAYTFTGQPLVQVNPTRGFVGILGTVPQKEINTKAEWVDKRLGEISKLTGADFSIKPVAPSPYLHNEDLRLIKSSVGKATVWDEYVTAIAQSGMVEDLYSTLRSYKGSVDNSSLAMGGHGSENRGPLIELIQKKIEAGHKAAWNIVEAKEVANKNLELIGKINIGKQIKLNRIQSSFDRGTPEIFTNPLNTTKE